MTTGRAQRESTPATSDLTIDHVQASSYRVPLEMPQSDGTLTWDHTSVVVAEARAGSTAGLGYSYGSEAAARLIDDTLAEEVVGLEPVEVPRAWTSMVRAVRNLGRPGIASHAIAAVDIALWDLKARLLEVPLVHLLGRVRDQADVYGSGGFTSASVPQLCDQLEGWAEQGIPRVKVKVGRHSLEDVTRVEAARQALGPDVELFVAPTAPTAARKRSASPMPMWFADHVAVERLLFDGAPVPVHGRLAPDTTAPGLGLELKKTDAAPYQT